MPRRMVTTERTGSGAAEICLTTKPKMVPTTFQLKNPTCHLLRVEV